MPAIDDHKYYPNPRIADQCFSCNRPPEDHAAIGYRGPDHPSPLPGCWCAWCELIRARDHLTRSVHRHGHA